MPTCDTCKGFNNIDRTTYTVKKSVQSVFLALSMNNISGFAVVYQVVGFFDVAARLCAGDGPIAALVGVNLHR